jgi:hypothetical protein
MTDDITAPSGPWDPGREPFSIDGILNGQSNLSGWRQAIDTEGQRMSGALRITAFKLASDNKFADFYSIFGEMTHGVSHSGGDYDPGRNWVSVGYYATRMSLTLTLRNDGPGCQIWDAGPTSTVGSSTTSFNIGGSLSGGMFGENPILQAGVSGSFGASFAAPDVRFATSQVGDTIRWDVSLPGVGFTSPGVPANPEEPSYAGYKWYFGVIYLVPPGHGLSLAVVPEIAWEFDYTRGITNDRKTWNPQDQVFTFQ